MRALLRKKSEITEIKDNKDKSIYLIVKEMCGPYIRSGARGKHCKNEVYRI